MNKNNVSKIHFSLHNDVLKYNILSRLSKQSLDLFLLLFHFNQDKEYLEFSLNIIDFYNKSNSASRAIELGRAKRSVLDIYNILFNLGIIENIPNDMLDRVLMKKEFYYLLKLGKAGFTKIDRDIFFSIKKKNEAYLFIFLSSWRSTGLAIKNFEYMKALFSLPHYSNSKLIFRVIEPAIAYLSKLEIFEFLNVKYQKRGKSYYNIQFDFKFRVEAREIKKEMYEDISDEEILSWFFPNDGTPAINVEHDFSEVY